MDLGRAAGPNFMQIKLGPPAGLGAGPDVHKIGNSAPWHKIGPAVKWGGGPA